MSIQPGKNILVTVASAEVGESKTKGTPGVFFKFENDEGQIEGELWLSGGALERSLNTLREAFAFNDDFATFTEQVTGKQCVIEVEMQEYKGKNYPKVKWINAVRTSAKPASASSSRALSAASRAAAAASACCIAAAALASASARRSASFRSNAAKASAIVPANCSFRLNSAAAAFFSRSAISARFLRQITSDFSSCSRCLLCV